MTSRKWKRAGLATLIVAACMVLLLNVSAWHHARSMTRFVESGERTASPEDLSRMQKLGVLFRGVRISRPSLSASPADSNLSSETIRLAGARGSTIEAWWIPANKAIGSALLFHGYSGCRSDLLDRARFYHDAGFHVMLVDFHGSGGSSGDTTSIGFHEAEDVAAAWRWTNARDEDRPIVLHGISMGAAAVLRAVAHEDVAPDALVLESPFSKLLTTVGNRFRAMGLPPFPAARCLLFWGGRQQDFNPFSHNPVDYAREVDCPTLLLHGENDPRVAVQDFLKLREAFPGQTTLHIFEDAGHESLLSSHGDLWRQKVTEFVEQAVTSGDAGGRVPVPGTGK